MKRECNATPTLRGLLGGLLAAMVLATPVSAQEQTAGLRVRIWGGAVGRYVLSDNEPFASPGFGTVALKVDGSAPGFGGDIEYRLSRWFGIDAAIGYTKLNVDFTSSNDPGTTGTQSFGVMPLLLAIDVHLISARSVDIWAGPQIGYVIFPDNLSYSAGSSGTFTYKPEGVFSKKGFVVGTDIRLSKTIALNFAVRWQDADGDAAGNLTIDPTFVTLGLTKKF